MNKNYIAELLNLVDEDSKITNVSIEGQIKYITLEKNITSHYCPYCGTRMLSKGKFYRYPKHDIFQDGYNLKLVLIGNRWKCANKSCNYGCRDQFNFIDKYKKTTNIINLQILHTLKDIKLSCRQVAKQFNVSDSYVYTLFTRYVDLPRLSLTEYISIDEVYLNLSIDCKYALIIMDFITGDIIDLLPSRRSTFTADYFKSLPQQEKDKVKYLICDMYDPYVNYTKSYFPNAVAITDSFHVLQWLLHSITNYINEVKRKFMKRDNDRLKENNNYTLDDKKSVKTSREVYILNKASWVIRKKKTNWYISERRFDRHLNEYLDSYDWEKMFLALDNNFPEIQRLKELYEDFNSAYINDIPAASIKLEELINTYNQSNITLFKEFANTLKRHKETILNSFTYVKTNKLLDNKEVLRRLSNGAMESFNNIPSALRTQSHGINNFWFFRNRILWHVRKKPAILATPKTMEQIHNPGKKRGSYNKDNKK